MKKRILALTMAAMMIIAVLSGCNGGESSTTDEATGSSAGTTTSTETNSNTNDEYYDETVTLTVLVDQDWLTTYEDAIMAISDATLEKYNIKIELENRINGSDGDNQVKTRLAAGEMTDILIFNSGAQLMALNPESYFVDLSGYDFIDTIDDNFVEAVSSDGKVYGVPAASSQVGGIVYNKEVYEELGLEIPLTWDDFMSNLEACSQAGYTGILGTCGDPWSAQYILLADHYNVLAEYPDFAQDFEANIASYADTEIALRSWEKLSAVGEYLNSDYMATTVMDGLETIVEEDGPIHYAFSSQAFSYIEQFNSREDADNYSIFPIPSDDENVNGFTVFMPNGVYANKDSKNVDAAVKFLQFYASEEGMNIFKQYADALGPYLTEGVDLPEDSYAGVLDIQEYFDAGKTSLALEFQTSLKGASCDQICVEAISGSMTAQKAASTYDDDCKKMAVQLGLEGWE